MGRVLPFALRGIGTKLTVGFGILVGLTLLVVALAIDPKTLYKRLRKP